jgi:hypothetical protein
MKPLEHHRTLNCKEESRHAATLQGTAACAGVGASLTPEPGTQSENKSRWDEAAMASIGYSNP